MLTFIWIIVSAAFISSTVAVKLYVASYSGIVTTLSLTQDSNGSYQLANISSTPAPSNTSSLTLDSQNHVLYAIDEGISVKNGSVASFQTSPNGALGLIDREETLVGGVSGVIYGQSNISRAIAVAQ